MYKVITMWITSYFRVLFIIAIMSQTAIKAMDAWDDVLEKLEDECGGQEYSDNRAISSNEVIINREIIDQSNPSQRNHALEELNIDSFNFGNPDSWQCSKCFFTTLENDEIRRHKKLKHNYKCIGHGLYNITSLALARHRLMFHTQKAKSTEIARLTESEKTSFHYTRKNHSNRRRLRKIAIRKSTRLPKPNNSRAITYTPK